MPLSEGIESYINPPPPDATNKETKRMMLTGLESVISDAHHTPRRCSLEDPLKIITETGLELDCWPWSPRSTLLT